MKPSEEAAPRIASVDCGIQAPLRWSGTCYLPDDPSEGDQGVDYGPASRLRELPRTVLSSLARRGEIRPQDCVQLLDRRRELGTLPLPLYAVWIVGSLKEHRRYLGLGDTHIVRGLHNNLTRAVQHLGDWLL